MYEELDKEMMEDEELENSPTGEGDDADLDDGDDDVEEGLDEEEM